MKRPWRSIWLMSLGAAVFYCAAFMTLRAAERMTERSATASQLTGQPSPAARVPGQSPPAVPPSHPAPSVPEESATIADDPTTAPDASQSADNNVSFPADI
jgi:hypothetical protein